MTIVTHLEQVFCKCYDVFLFYILNIFIPRDVISIDKNDFSMSVPACISLSPCQGRMSPLLEGSQLLDYVSSLPGEISLSNSSQINKDFNYICKAPSPLFHG